MNSANCNNMPGIIRVMWLKAENVAPHVMEKFVAGIPVALGSEGNELKLVDTGQASSLITSENNGLTDKATLEFKTTSPVPMEEDVVWAAMDASEQWWLIGARERNFPIVEVNRTSGTPGGDPAVTSVKVTHAAKIAIIPVSL